MSYVAGLVMTVSLAGPFQAQAQAHATVPVDGAAPLRAGEIPARGTVPCAQERGQALGMCYVAISRSDDGNTTVLVTFKNGFSRKLTFAHGAFVSGNPTMSGAGTDTDWRLVEDVHHIRVDDQRYLVPDALLFTD